LAWTKQLRSSLNIPTSSNLPDPAFTALSHRTLDLLYRKLFAAIRDNRIHELVTDFVANHHEVLDHSRSLLPLLRKIETLSMLVRRSIVADPTIPTVAALYLFDRVMSTLTTEALTQFGERRRVSFKHLTDNYKKEAEAIRSVLGSCPVGILVTDREGYIIHFNQVQEAISRRPATKVLGKRLYYDYAHRDAEFKEAFSRAVQKGETAHFNRRRYVSSNGVQYLDVTLAPVRNEHNDITGVVQMLEDVTARVDLEEKLRAQNRDLTTRLSELEEAYEYIGRINRQFASLVDINTTLSSKLSLDKLLDFIVRSAAMLTRARLTTLRLIEGTDLVLAAQSGYTPQEQQRYNRMPASAASVADVLNQEHIVISDLQRNNLLNWPELRELFKLKQRLSVPLRSRGRTIGILQIHLQEMREFSLHEQNFLLVLANHAALALDLDRALSSVRARQSAVEPHKPAHQTRQTPPLPPTIRPRPAKKASASVSSLDDSIRYAG